MTLKTSSEIAILREVTLFGSRLTGKLRSRIGICGGLWLSLRVSPCTVQYGSHQVHVAI